MNLRIPTRHIPLATAVVILGVMLGFGAWRYDHFLSVPTVTGLFAEYSFVGIAAVGATLVILAGGIDLSVGAVVAFTSILIAELIGRGVHPLAAAGFAVMIGGAFGLSQGLLIYAFELPAFMVTLAGMFAMRALGFVVHPQSLSVHHAWYDRLRDAGIPLGDGTDLPLRGAVFIAVLIAAWVVTAWTPFGRRIHALGGHERAARAMGVPIGATRVAVYTLAGACSALGGVVFTLYKEAGDPAACVGLELDVIAAVVIGGTLLSGGVGSMLGTLVGVLILGVIRLLIDYQGNLNSAWTSVSIGAMLLCFIALQRAVSSWGAAAAYRGSSVTPRLEER